VTDVIPRGRFVWHELITNQPDQAAAFYGKLAGWKSSGWEHDPTYRIFDYQGAPRAGMMAPRDDAKGVPPLWLSYVAVPDVDETVKQAQRQGATVHQVPMDVPTVGRLAVLADPQGATLAVFRPSITGEPGDEVPPADFSWHELATNDWRSAWNFYRGLFGWEKESEMDMGPDLGTYFMFKRAGGTKSIGAMYNKPPQIPVANWLPYILVPSADRAATVAKANKGTVMFGPMEVPGGDRVAQIMDPVGAVIAVHAYAVAAAAKPAAKAKAKPARKAKPVKAPKKRAKKKTTKRKTTMKKRAQKKPARRR
jgi:predicted enzyme related to lactoylglutathione lyase